ncbi:MAG: hypothetical protein LBL46_02035 [Rickettsiales bacterium]|nr:hypothetical protein [Rickettsiales bacterium]
MLKKAKQTFRWTIFYAAAATMVFYMLFGFNIWSARHWAILSGMTLRGAEGFFLGAMIVAFIPAYLATAIFVWKNGKWPVSPPAFLKKKKEEKKEDGKDEAQESPVFPADLPDEMKAPYLRAKSGALWARTAADFIKRPAIDAGRGAGSGSLDTFMPPPESFDMTADDGPEAGSQTQAPTFSDFSFGGGEAPAGKLKIENDAATYIFDEPGFWVADDENWFAEGRQIPSPIAELLATPSASKIIILKNRNIGDLDALIPKWEKLGIVVS